ncbi:unnamed protein product [Bursaphelenchus okinawaensis]|uniref:Serpentine receptor class gamma n=1 Tax=Bursaphelenchus okinawaensis TaxID=465554 RepID=A0A811KEA6_9BILA|nr:unnamed protein product [Bursaphelenchus okinawaensis]CAG9102874.1 unnamed protein product [Bursaphelenchus okinawaensis]
MIGSVLGVILNCLLMYIIFKTTTQQNKEYTKMLKAASFFDMLFSFTELITQHTLVVKRGWMIMIPNGFEKWAGANWYVPFYMLHMFVMAMGMYIFLAQYHYRYSLLSQPVTSEWLLFRNIVIAMTVSILAAVFSVWVLNPSLVNGSWHYLKFLDKMWSPDGNKTYAYAIDTDYPRALAYFYLLGVLSTVFFWSCVFYVYKIMKYVYQPMENISSKTRRMQIQFTVVIIIQGLTCFLFSYLPISFIAVFTLLRTQNEYVGLFMLMPLSWLPATNGLVSLLLVKAHRSTLFNMLLCRKRDAKNAIGQSTVQSLG